jgi:hypothetical protein
VQLAGHIDAETWSTFLTEIARDVPKPGPVRYIPLVGFFLGFLLVFVIGIFAIAIIVVSIFAMPALQALHHRKVQESFATIANRHQESMSSKGVTLSYQCVTEQGSRSSQTYQWLQLITSAPMINTPTSKPTTGTQINVMVPPGVAPGTQIIVNAPDGRQVSVVTPAGSTPGSTFLVTIPPPVVQAVAVAVPVQAQLVIATKVCPLGNQVAEIAKGGFNPATGGFKKAKSMVVATGVPYDSTGDGVKDATGFDTTGNGKIDAIDTTGDGVINQVIGNSQVTAGDKVTATEDNPNHELDNKV